MEAQEVKKVRYKLLGGTPFAKTDIDEVRENESHHAANVLGDALGLLGRVTTEARRVKVRRK